MLQLVLFSCSMEPASSSALPPVWLELVADYVDCKKVVLPQVTEILPCKPAHTANPTAFLLPPVLPWSPQEAYNCPLMCPVCTNDQRTPLVADAWGLGQSNVQYNPRFLHGVNSPTLLISRVYKCQNGHIVPAHSPGVLKQIPLYISVPFRLSHRSGFTRDLEDFLRQHLDATVSSRRTCQFLADNRQKFHRDRCCLYQSIHHNSCTAPAVTYAEWQQYFPPACVMTSHSVLIASYVHQLQQDTAMYHLHMTNLTVDSKAPYLTCDHTFKTAGQFSTDSMYVAIISAWLTRLDVHIQECTCFHANAPLRRLYMVVHVSWVNVFPTIRTVNIGMHRASDNKWITQRSALFCVLNSDGQVLTWKLTNSVKFAHCTDVLTNLRDRLERQQKSVTEFVVDNCCSWRRQLHTLFGSHLTVLLDLFHATQRVLEKIPKRHKMRAMCVSDFRLVFRDPADRGMKRTKPTPAPGIYRKLHSSIYATYVIVFNPTLTPSCQAFKSNHWVSGPHVLRTYALVLHTQTACPCMFI